jgi:carboxyl-terminal processing protease
MRPLARRAAVPALVAAAFFAGLSVDHAARAGARDDERYRALDVLAQVLGYVEGHWVDEIAPTDLIHGAIEGAVGRLDSHTAFLRPDVHRAMREETAGEFEGVGVELAVRDGALVVIAPLAGSPAERGGLRPGDRVVEIDGAPTRDMAAVEASRRLKGPIGTPVRLTVQREPLAQPQALVLVRDRIRTRSVEWRVVDHGRGIVHVRLKGFQERTDRAVKRALDEARAELGGELGGVILDVRNNPGGLLEQAVRVADRFLRDGVIVSTAGRGGRQVEVERAHEKDTEPGYPMAILVNRGSASASEIVAGALQDHGRATVVGSRTFGKGSVQQVFDLADGSGLKLTVARYHTPKHRTIQDRGIEPDLAVADRPEGEPAAPVSSSPNVNVATPVDPPLEAALADVAARAGPPRRPAAAAPAVPGQPTQRP